MTAAKHTKGSSMQQNSAETGGTLSAVRQQEELQHAHDATESIHGRILQLRQQHRDELDNLREQQATETAAIRREIDDRLATERQQAKEREQQILEAAERQNDLVRRQRDADTAELERSYDAQKRQLQSRQDDNEWVLDSVLDPNAASGPVAESQRAVLSRQREGVDVEARLASLSELQLGVVAYLKRSWVSAGVDPLNVVPKWKKSDQCLNALQSELAEAESACDSIYKQFLPRLLAGFRALLTGLLIALVVAVVAIAIKVDLRLLLNPDVSKPDWNWVLMGSLIGLSSGLLVTVILVVISQQGLRSRYEDFLLHFSIAGAAADHWGKLSNNRIARLEKAADEWTAKAEAERDRRREAAERAIEQDLAAASERRLQKLSAAEARFQSESETIRADMKETVQQARELLEMSIEKLNSERQDRIASAEESFKASLQRCEQQFAEQEAQLRQKWRQTLNRADMIVRVSREHVVGHDRWPSKSGDTVHWKTPESVVPMIPVGVFGSSLTVPSSESPEEIETTNRSIELPALISFPADWSISIAVTPDQRAVADRFVRMAVLKLLCTLPAGRLRFTFIDPLGLGQSLATFMHLTDFDEVLVNHRIWTERTHIREQLQRITEHMEGVFQMYLRNQFETIEDYNDAAGEVAEPYHIVVISGFPAAFGDDSISSLKSILSGGRRCGVRTIVTFDPEQSLPPGIAMDDLLRDTTKLRVVGQELEWSDGKQPHVIFEDYPTPEPDHVAALIREIGRQSRDARRVEVPFGRISPSVDQLWLATTAAGIDVGIGRAGAARLQYLRLGRGTSQHVMIAGKTGSGKSTLLHILITNLALTYSPDEIEFYLVDFKKGVEFRTYASHQLPHARVVAIESDREFGLSVLERLDEVLQERGDLFRELGVQDVPSFREQFPDRRMPRILLLIDEFQEFFVADDKVASKASLLLDRLVRQGRAFGIHVLLGSQTLGGAYSLPRSTLGQIAVRIALQCSEGDAHLILSEDNSAARLLTRPGEAIYNDANGMVEGNHPFQVAWLGDDERSRLLNALSRKTVQSADQYPATTVFEGTRPPTLEHNTQLFHMFSTGVLPQTSPNVMTFWLGEPVAIGEATSIEFERGSGANMLMVGSDRSAADGMIATILLSARARGQQAAGGRNDVRVVVIDGRSDGEDNDWWPALTGLLGDRCRTHTVDDADAAISSLSELLERREAATDPADERIVVVIRGIGSFRTLRKRDDDFGFGGYGEKGPATPADQLSDLIKRGPAVGVHFVVHAETFSDVNRWLGSSLLREFEFRAATRLNQTDSSNLLDSPTASQLPGGRALLYRDRTGDVEKFRPFAEPTTELLRQLTHSTSDELLSDADPTDLDSWTVE